MEKSPDFWPIHDQDVISCRKCPRLVEWREKTAREKRRAYLNEEYWGKPVPGFGDTRTQILVVGLAPGAHGSNRTGRMFTGDASGDFLYFHLHATGFASGPKATDLQDGLSLTNMYISAVCRCAPPDNRPSPNEIDNCLPYLSAEYDHLPLKGIVALGSIAYEWCIRFIHPNHSLSEFPKFAHGAFITGSNAAPWILASYHPSRQNTQTGRLTNEMFRKIWETARELL